MAALAALLLAGSLMAGLLLAEAIPPSGATPRGDATPEVALAADVTLPSVIAPPGADLALTLESAGRIVHGPVRDPGNVLDPANALRPVSAPGPVDTETGAVSDPVPLTVADAGVSDGPVPPAVRPGPFAVPVSGAQISSTFGYRVDPTGGYGSEFHTGVDWAVDCGTPVTAAEGGAVTESGWHAYGGGQRIVVDHGGGMRTTYNHLSALGVMPGQPVGRGELLGAVGSTGNSTGCHLHFEVMVGEEKVDPQRWL